MNSNIQMCWNKMKYYMAFFFFLFILHFVNNWIIYYLEVNRILLNNTYKYIYNYLFVVAWRLNVKCLESFRSLAKSVRLLYRRKSFSFGGQDWMKKKENERQRRRYIVGKRISRFFFFLFYFIIFFSSFFKILVGFPTIDIKTFLLFYFIFFFSLPISFYFYSSLGLSFELNDEINLSLKDS